MSDTVTKAPPVPDYKKKDFVSDQQVPYSRRSQVHGDRATESAHADNQHLGIHQFLLTGHIHFRQHNLATVA